MYCDYSIKQKSLYLPQVLDQSLLVFFFFLYNVRFFTEFIFLQQLMKGYTLTYK